VTERSAKCRATKPRMPAMMTDRLDMSAFADHKRGRFTQDRGRDSRGRASIGGDDMSPYVDSEPGIDDCVLSEAVVPRQQHRRHPHPHPPRRRSPPPLSCRLLRIHSSAVVYSVLQNSHYDDGQLVIVPPFVTPSFPQTNDFWWWC
jgi:hypothetical protein